MANLSTRDPGPSSKDKLKSKAAPKSTDIEAFKRKNFRHRWTKRLFSLLTKVAIQSF